MRLKDLLRSAALFTRTNFFGEAANDDGVSITRETMAYVAKGETNRLDRTVRLSANWQRIGTLVGEALAHQPEDTNPEAVGNLTALHEAIRNIAARTDETSVFNSMIELDQPDIDTLIDTMPYMAMVANHFIRKIKDGTTFLGAEIDEENDQIKFNRIENGPAQFAKQHLDEVQMFAFRARHHLTAYADPQFKPDEQALVL